MPRSLSTFALLLIAAYLFIGNVIFLYLALASMAFGLFFSRHSFALDNLFAKFSKMWARVIAKLFLTVIFFGMLFPLAFIRRLFERDILKIRRRLKIESYYVGCDQEISSQYFEKPW